MNTVRPTVAHSRDAVWVSYHEIDNGVTRPATPVRSGLARRILRPLVQSGLPIHCANTAEPVIALTFDDGPDPVQTPRILDLLAERSVPATFFVIGRFAAEHPEILQRMLDEGHEIAFHGWDHRRLSHMTTRGARIFIDEGRRRLEDQIGRPVRFYRPPYGAQTFRQTRALRGLGLEVVKATCECHDWLDGDPAVLADELLHFAHPGAIHVQHDRRADPETLAPGQKLPVFDRSEVTRTLLDGLRAHGYLCLGLSDLVDRYPSVITRNPGDAR